MKGTKRYTPRKAMDTATDPYLNRQSPRENSVCRQCGAVFHNKRWYTSEQARPQAGKGGIDVLCPACQKIKDRFVGGVVTLTGRFLAEHRDEILKLIYNKEERSKQYNPLGRIISIHDMKDRIEITTTTDKLAQRIGQVLNKTYQGKVTYKWSDDVKLARVQWSR